MTDPRVEYLEAAEAFAAATRGTAPFRYLKWYVRCDDAQLDFLIKKIYCDSLPEVVPEAVEPWKAALKSLLHPIAFAASKSWLWSASPAVDFDVETIDRPYFDKWFAAVYRALPGTKRVTPRHGSAGFDGFDVAAPVGSVVSPSTLARLQLSPLVLPAVLAAARRLGRPAFIDAYRRALSFYAIFDGHFRRYPCRDFLTYADETNHPARHIAFRQNCSGRMFVVQNGERSQHPMHAYGMVDVYLSFGAFGERLFRDLRMHAPSVVPVGALCLNERHGLAKELESAGGEPLYDVLFIDQSVWPLNGLDRKTGESFLPMFRNLDKLKERRPSWRIVYQLRNYSAHPEEKRRVLEVLSGCFRHGIEILDNAGRGESYASIARARLVITFSSTLGVEAFFFGKNKKVLFFNYAGNPYDEYAPEPRFQLTDASGDYDVFERKVDELMALELPRLPPSVLDRHFAFDGKVQDRIATAVSGGAK